MNTRIIKYYLNNNNGSSIWRIGGFVAAFLVTVCMLSAASTPVVRASDSDRAPFANEEKVDLLLLSDNATWISVTGPVRKKPAKFKKMTYRLLPGEYQILGRKKGYSDVKLLIEVGSGDVQLPVTIICDERR